MNVRRSRVPADRAGAEGSTRGYALGALASGLMAAAATTVVLALTALPALARATASGRGLKDPRHDRRMSQATVNACQSAPDSANCVRLALIDINAARHSEGVGPMHLPGRFRALTRPQQLMVLSNLERIGRGLPAILGLTSRLDRAARRGALNFGDPVPPSNWYTFSNGYSSNFAYGFNSTLEADFEWMYDDGYRRNGFNYECQVPHQTGCWGHRHDILLKGSTPIVMGAAVLISHHELAMTELFIFGDRDTGRGQPDHPLAPTWSSLSH